MSSYEELEYFFESAGLDNGPQILIIVLILSSIILGAVAAEWLLRNSEESNEQKIARKALAVVLNEGKSQEELEAED